MNVNTPENVKKIGDDFFTIITEWFNEIGIEKPTRDQILNANDYHDANMAMHEAFLKSGLDPSTDGNLNDDNYIELWNSAFNHAAERASS